ncbi:MAG: hypothetical protein VYA51_06620 [Planctomycetota bacterium]|nr:hypothetical protein [Planctomycetota bacterium]MEC9047669.1 hypothetical protein [Planctomycetota bacterium]
MSADRRHKGVLWDVFVDDGYRKLMAVGLAVILWFFINSRIMDAADYVLPLRVVDQLEMSSGENELAVALPMDRVVKQRFLDGDREIQDVTVTVSGPRFRIDALKEEPLNLVVRTLLNREWARSGDGGDVQVVEFGAADIRRSARALEEVDIAMSPPLVRLEVRVQDNVVLAVRKEHVEFLAEGFASRLLLEKAQFTPPEVKVLGPARSIQKFAERFERGEPVLRAQLDEIEPQASGQLTIIDGPEMGLYFQQPASVRVDLLPTRDDYTFELPVVVDDLNLKEADRGVFLPSEPRIPLRVSLSGRLRVDVGVIESDEARQRWAEANLRLVVHLQRPEDGNRFGEVLSRPLHLVPIGPLLERTEVGEYKIEGARNVTLRRKNP